MLTKHKQTTESTEIIELDDLAIRTIIGIIDEGWSQGYVWGDNVEHLRWFFGKLTKGEQKCPE